MKGQKGCSKGGRNSNNSKHSWARIFAIYPLVFVLIDFSLYESTQGNETSPAWHFKGGKDS
jgi:hypothetical protein